MAIYAYDYELAHALTAASNPLAREMRLVWWREVLDEIFEGRQVRGHPTALALAEAVRRRGLERAPLEDMIDGRYRLLDPTPLDKAEVIAFGIMTAGAAGRVAAGILAPPTDLAWYAARDWNALWAAARLPAERIASGERPRVSDEVRRSLAEARTVERRDLPAAAFPAVAHVALTDAYLAGRRPSELGKRWRLLWAVLTGRV